VTEANACKQLAPNLLPGSGLAKTVTTSPTSYRYNTKPTDAITAHKLLLT